MTVDAPFRPPPGFAAPWIRLPDYLQDQTRGLRELQTMPDRWRRQAEWTDRDHGCADELDEVLQQTEADELQMLSVRWHSLAALSGGSHRCAEELDDWLLRHTWRVG